MRILFWGSEKLRFPKLINNFYFKIDFGRFSLFLGKGKNYKDLQAGG